MSKDMFSKADELEDRKYRERATLLQPDIDDLMNDCVVQWKLGGPAKLKQALYQRLAAEAEMVEFTSRIDGDYEGYAIPLTRLKAIMEIKES